MGSGGVFFGLLLIPHIRSQAEVLDGWWTPIAIVIVCVPLIALIPASFARDVRWIGWMGTLAAIGWMTSAILWLPALSQSRISPQQDVWLSTFPAIAAMATAFSWPVWATVIYLGVSSALAQILHHVTRADQNFVTLGPEILFITMFCSLFVAATIMAMRTGSVLDEAVVRTRTQAALSASAAARDAERKRVDSFVHDRVMSTLLALAREGNTTELTNRARATLDELQAAVNEDPLEESVTCAAAVSAVRSAVERAWPEAPIFESVDEQHRNDSVPSLVARAIATAAAEAITNSLRHAGSVNRRVDRIVDITANADKMTVIVADNGAGFDQRRVPPDRLGLATSIRAQMHQVENCAVTIVSERGVGTAVTLTWHR